jgi:hypothetical protein
VGGLRGRGEFAHQEVKHFRVNLMGVVTLVRSELIRELPNGTFAPPTMSQAIKLRRVGGVTQTN